MCIVCFYQTVYCKNVTGKKWRGHATQFPGLTGTHVTYMQYVPD